MQKLFIDYTPDEKIYLDPEQSRHIAKSLRMRVGDMLTVADCNGNEYGCQIDEITKDTVCLKICYQQANKTEPTCKVSIYQGVPKSAKMEDIIQKCTELGVCQITPVLTKRCVSRPDEKSADKKNQRYQKIALEAAQQSGRGIVPQINSMVTLKQALAQDNPDVKMIFYEGGGESLKALVNPQTQSVSIYIGPEGGFEKDEVDAVINAGGSVATLGPRILRTQTAPVAALSEIMLLTDNME